MKKTIKALKFSLVFSLLLASFLACDKDFSVIESNVLGEQNANFFTDSVSFQIAAYNKKLEALQINGLSSTLLGVYNDPAYGQTIASIVTQLVPSTYAPDFGDNPVIDSVILTIPYFNRITGTNEDGSTKYTILDSLYGRKSDGSVKQFKLYIYQNKYLIRDIDPFSNTNERQNYFSKADGTVLNGSSNINFDSPSLKGNLVYATDSIVPSSNPTKTSIGTGTNKVTTQSAPALRIKLQNPFWKTAIIDQEGSSSLSSASEFSNYFRGLYFKAEPFNGDGNMILLNLASTNANITIYYSKDSSVAGEKTQASYVLRFTGNILNTFNNDYSTVPFLNGDRTTGDEKLYLKGTEGSMAVVDLFSGANALETFLNDYRIPIGNGNYKKDANGNYILKRLINDAQLIVYEDETMPTQAKYTNGDDYHKYDRLYAYDIKNNIPVDDYSSDPTVNNTSAPYFSTYFHLGLRNTNAAVSKYKIHLTEHLNNILLRDSTNTKLGLTLSSNVNLVGNAKILNSTDEVTSVPTVSIITPRGTRLYGTKSNVPANRKMKLKIFYTNTK
ncbi:DUF4270 domain-containing protein [Mariniflexile jejuense]|uniref:DUF4270 domain-containing protein n=1 Tax=Mariniflexile jejuense TaxID=1173582 RepID=A0ABW3JME9_9FLAO